MWPAHRFPLPESIQHFMIRRIEMNRSERYRPLFKCLVVGILASAPRHTGPGNPIVDPTMPIDLLRDRIVEAPAAETGDSDSGDRSIRQIRNIKIHERFIRQTFF